MPPIPSLKWPAIWLALAVYFVGATFVDFAIDTEEDRAAALGFFPFAVIALMFACRHYGRRLKQRQQWRADRLMSWICERDLEPPPPLSTDEG